MKRITKGSNNPLPAPWEQCSAPPSGYSIACTSATPAFEKASPASVAANAIPSRASRFSGSETAVRRCRPISRIACSACASASGPAPSYAHGSPSA